MWKMVIATEFQEYDVECKTKSSVLEVLHAIVLDGGFCPDGMKETVEAIEVYKPNGERIL